MVRRNRRRPARAQRRRLSGHRRSDVVADATGSAGAGGGNPGTGGTGVQACDPTPIFARSSARLPSATTRTERRRTSTWCPTTGRRTSSAVNPKGAGLNPSVCAANGPYLVRGRAARDGAIPRQAEADHDSGLRRVDAAGRSEVGRGQDFACVQSWANALVMAGPSPTGAGGTSGGSGGVVRRRR